MEKWTLFLSAIAILISIISYTTSRISGNKSNKTQELQTRPWLISSIHKNDETDRYYNITEKDGYINWEIEIDIENKGTTPANNIRIPQQLNLKDIKTTNENLFFNIDNVILGQGQKYRYQLSIGGKPENKDNLEQMLKQYKKNDKGLLFKFSVLYNGLINQKNEYKSTTNFDIKSDKFSILNDSEFK